MHLRKSAALAGGLAAAAALPALALADAGPTGTPNATIAGAPVVVAGQSLGASTADVGSASADTLGCHSWWLVHAIRGDHLSVDFSGSPSLRAALYPAGTDDDNYEDSNPLADSRGSEGTDADAGGTGQAKFVVARSGTLPLSFSAPSCGGASTVTGPYSFTVYDLHGLIVSASATPLADGRSTQLSVSVHAGDGEAVSAPLSLALERHQDGGWIVNQSAAGAPANFTIHWRPGMIGHLQRLRVVVSGPGYWTTTKRIALRAQ